MTAIEKLIEDLTYVVKIMRDYPTAWDADGYIPEAKPLVADLFSLAETIEEGPMQ